MEQEFRDSQDMDLSGTLALVVVAPSRFSGSYGSYDDPRVKQLFPDLEEWISNNAPDPPAFDPAGPRIHHQVGPAAQGPPTYLYLLQQVHAALQASSPWLEWVLFVRQLAVWFRGWLREHAAQDEPQEVERLPIILSDRFIEYLCQYHAFRHYAANAEPTTDIQGWGGRWGYGSPSHPQGSEQYLVHAYADRRHYFYVVDGFGNVMIHGRLDRTRMVELPVPDLFDDPGAIEA